jgi:hypothetical protein
LSDEQQQKAVNTQLEENPNGRAFSTHLMAFSNIRANHEKIYLTKAFPSDQGRELIENFEVPNLQFINGKGGERNCEMRQKTRDGKFCAASTPSTPVSKYLQALCKALTAAALARIDEAILREPVLTEQKRTEQVAKILALDNTAAPVSIGTRLANLVQVCWPVTSTQTIE